MERIGIIGGTFNPPHNGHLLIANEVKSALELSEVWFMPNNIPPHKESGEMASVHHRIRMIELAIEDNPAFKLETIELERDGKSFTIDTIERLNQRYKGQYQFYFIIGADMVEYLPNWHRIQELSLLVTFVGVKRPGFSLTPPFPILEVDVPIFDVSSSLIRNRCKVNKSSLYLLPEKVRKYIEENQIYGSKTSS